MAELYILLLLALGGLILLTAWLPMVLREAPLSLPIVCVAIGAAAGWVLNLPISHPAQLAEPVERLTEFIVIIALMGAGLKIDRKLGWRSWGVTWRLLFIAMPLTILLLALAGTSLLALGAAPALLLAATLAPTDPVLASDVQVGPPKSGEEDETRFALTSEAGLNDGLAFPFVVCAIMLAEADRTGTPWLLQWLGIEVVWRLAAGCGAGIVVGYALGWLVFKMPNRAKLSKTGDGFVALGVTLIVYAIAESLHGYGFVAVFVAAVALRAAERNHKYHVTLHDFAEQLERLLMMIVLVLFGAALTGSALLSGLSAASVAFALLMLFIIRPICGWVALAGSGCPVGERAAISFFGIRGIGSIYYLAYAVQRETFPHTDLLWSATALIVLISIVLHGVTVTPAMRAIDRRRTQRRESLRPDPRQCE